MNQYTEEKKSELQPQSHCLNAKLTVANQQYNESDIDIFTIGNGYLKRRLDVRIQKSYEEKEHSVFVEMSIDNFFITSKYFPQQKDGESVKIGKMTIEYEENGYLLYIPTYSHSRGLKIVLLTIDNNFTSVQGNYIVEKSKLFIANDISKIYVVKGIILYRRHNYVYTYSSKEDQLDDLIRKDERISQIKLLQGDYLVINTKKTSSVHTLTDFKCIHATNEGEIVYMIDGKFPIVAIQELDTTEDRREVARIINPATQTTVPIMFEELTDTSVIEIKVFDLLNSTLQFNCVTLRYNNVSESLYTVNYVSLADLSVLHEELCDDIIGIIDGYLMSDSPRKEFTFIPKC